MKHNIRMLLKWFMTAKIATIPRKHLGKIATYIITIKRVLYFYNDPSNAHLIKIIKRVKKETEMLQSDLQAHQIYLAAQKTEKIKGDIAEVGVYKGGTAKLICETTKKRSIHLFDTFEGLPDVEKHDSHKQFKKGDYLAQLDFVKKCLSKYKNVHFYKGYFPETAGPIKNKMFSFIHLDVDIYESTLSSLIFFYPRMSRGAMLVSHDYPSAKGVKKAFDDYFKDKPEIIIELPLCDQCVIVKL